ncbi:hypothetical protein sscle_03g022180 [Sclerotinia sclerotiorum 1980 UF-70]|uniref:Heterokaryon incompatibility domain-containing protein n=1 Tax=Sclerotinia sclerotiorum (strain ATCC 18683 / 1980 / Ss-1) TaxID=665079 RepID=A0A1D9PXK5_SCLS1|nr:hypothetical protein sscle_03g022180 [Sclerotinia sclerotiorum 1980 UF-70]
MRCELCKNLTLKRLSKNHRRIRLRRFGGFPSDIQDLEKYAYQHHKSWASLEDSAREGCELCLLFKKTLHKKYPSLPENTRPRLDEADTNSEIDSDSSHFLYRYGDDRVFIGLDHSESSAASGTSVDLGSFANRRPWINQLCIFLGYFEGLGPDCHVRIDLFISREDPYADKTFILGRDIDPQPFSRRNIELVENWILNCKAKHPVCAASHAERPLPTRVIYIDADSQSLPKHARILETQGRSGYYASLSYCWGDGPDDHKTTKRNIRERRNRLIVEDLPQTLKDAILVTRKLGLQYIWIDSICIIQDSPSDKGKELTHMNDVYHNAFINIAAGNARCSQDGFLHNRERSTFRLDWDKRGSDRKPQIFCGPPAETWPDCASKGVLSTRGWTFQERLLSPRTLYFGKDQIHWECDTCIFSENQILAVRDHVSAPAQTGYMSTNGNTVKHDMRDWTNYVEQIVAFSHSRPKGFRKIFYRDTTSPKSGSLKQIESLGGYGGMNDFISSPESTMLSFQKWTAIVSEYSRRTLSNSHDKLDALSGVAQQLAEVNPREYVAGIWTPDIFELRGLLWVQKSVAPAVRDRESGKIQKRRYCPSWSWASVEGEIHYHNWHDWEDDSWESESHQVINKAKVESLRFCLSREEHPYGDVLKGGLVLRGQFGYLPREIAWGSSRFFGSSNPASMIRITIDTKVRERHGLEILSCRSRRTIMRSTSQPLKLSPLRINEDSISHLRRIPYCIRIMDVIRDIGGRGDNVTESWFLLLEPVKTPEEGIFRRIGIGNYIDIMDCVSTRKWNDTWKSEERTIKII